MSSDPGVALHKIPSWLGGALVASLISLFSYALQFNVMQYDIEILRNKTLQLEQNLIAQAKMHDHKIKLLESDLRATRENLIRMQVGTRAR